MQQKGDSFRFLGKVYARRIFTTLKIGDKVIIHPIKRKSKAIKSYPAQIVEKEYDWGWGHKTQELVLKGIGKNSSWAGAILNSYGFKRLQFQSRDKK